MRLRLHPCPAREPVILKRAWYIRHRFPLDRIQEAFETFCRGETGKAVVMHA